MPFAWCDRYCDPVPVPVKRGDNVVVAAVMRRIADGVVHRIQGTMYRPNCWLAARRRDICESRTTDTRCTSCDKRHAGLRRDCHRDDPKTRGTASAEPLSELWTPPRRGHWCIAVTVALTLHTSTPIAWDTERAHSSSSNGHIAVRAVERPPQAQVMAGAKVSKCRVAATRPGSLGGTRPIAIRLATQISRWRSRLSSTRAIAK